MPRRESWRAREVPPPFDGSILPDAVRAKAARGWHSLHIDERDSATAAGLLFVQLSRLGAPPEILGQAHRVLEDEIRHVEVSGHMVHALGGSIDLPQFDATRASLGEGDVERRLAEVLIAGFGVGEALSAALFAAARKRSTVPLARWAFTELLRDEARHGPFGIAVGAWLIRGWDPAQRLSLWPACVREMESFEQRLGGPLSPDAIASPSSNATGELLTSLGLLPRAEAMRAVLEAIPARVIPKLRTLGVVPETGQA